MTDLLGKEFKVLDKGKVVLLDWMGSDSDIANSARISYGKGTRSISDDRNLIRYLIRHSHSSPLEMAEVKVYLKLPLYVWQQILRHRTAKFANINQYSGRYSEIIDEFQTTDANEWREQNPNNKQGSAGYVTHDTNEYTTLKEKEQRYMCGVGDLLSESERELHELAREVYEERLKCGVAREQARKDIPFSNFTEVFFKCDLHNLLHFLKLRLDEKAQLEVREYANTIALIVKELFPITYEAFNDYVLEATSFSGLESAVLTEIFNHRKDYARDLAIEFGWLGTNGELVRSRERTEFEDKLKVLGVSEYKW